MLAPFALSLIINMQVILAIFFVKKVLAMCFFRRLPPPFFSFGTLALLYHLIH
ncbi:hypothetical protein YE105_C3325 [Yersinia enterocolitica subsp. palearctica 105.5R(r)]|nr:hypothetical protein YE105_C3325 [Yersinia enterocolitica subsp. palearctica 105.5R(r)]